jgi:RNA polymerase sigma-70 factor (ECF subfamily)
VDDSLAGPSLPTNGHDSHGRGLLVQDLRLATLDDETLVGRATAGDREAFGELYERSVRRVFRHVFHMVNDVDLAEDLTEQTFLRALEAIHRYERRGVPFLAWLLRIARNLYLNDRRVQRNNSSIRNKWDGGAVASPEFFCEAKLDGEEVRRAVRALDGDQRQVIVLRFMDGLSYADVADVLGKSVGAVRVAQYRALRALRRRLEDGNLGRHYLSSS